MTPDTNPNTDAAPVVGLNAFARRHTPESRFSHFAGTEASLTGLVAACMGHSQDGPRDGVRIVPVPIVGFYAGLVVATDRMGLAAHWVRRADGEDHYYEVTAPEAPKAPAKSVRVVVYRRDVLLAGGKATTECPWEIVSINARADQSGEDEPPHPLSMARNHLNRPGGSPATYTVDDYAKAILYWSRRVHVGADPDKKPLTGIEFPPLEGTLILARDRCPASVDAVCRDWTFMPPPVVPEPPRPITLALRYTHALIGKLPTDPLDWAKSVFYWSQRPRKEIEPVGDL